MKATFYFTEEDVKAMVLERWAPRTDVYLHEGPEERQQVRITELHLYADGGWVEFSNEVQKTEPVPIEPPKVQLPVAEAPGNDIPF